MEASHILVERGDAGLATVTLNRPDKRNAITLEMWRRLRGIFGELGADATVRVIALRGAGGHFSAGADIKEFDTVRDTAAAGEAYERDVDGATLSIMTCPKPVVAVLEGFCLGGGLALAMGCDFRLAQAGVQFSVPAARIGTIYNLLDCQNLVALVGMVQAKRMLFNALAFGAKEAERMGLVDQVVDGDMAPALADFTAEMRENAPLAAAGHKLMLNAVAHGQVAERQQEIVQAFRTVMDSDDYREGTRAFAEKRPPRFVGR
jgi:enoyl-CoA hydratase/carnithine racemase